MINSIILIIVIFNVFLYWKIMVIEQILNYFYSSKMENLRPNFLENLLKWKILNAYPNIKQNSI